MSEARPFPYLSYDPDVVGDPGALLAPPYDVISAAERERLAEASPYQSVRIELPGEGGDAAAGALFREWIEEGVLEGDIGLALILQRYVGPDGVRRTRLGVACEIGLHEFDEGIVQPHERTFEGPRRQRVELMRHTGANISPVFALYHNPERTLGDLFAAVTDDQPDFTSVDGDGTQTAVWFVHDLAVCAQFTEEVARHHLLIADGHHRYTAALAWRAEARARNPHLSIVGGSDHDGPPIMSSTGINGVYAILCNSADPGICVFPTHRILEGADLGALDEFVVGSGAFTVTEHEDVAAALEALDAIAVPGFVVHHNSGSWLYELADPLDLELAAPGTSEAYRSLDVAALHDLVIDGGALLGQSSSATRYTRSLDEALDIVAESSTNIGLLMRAVDVDAIHRVAAAGEVLPQKSTYFFPKVPTGVMFRLLEP